MKLATVMCLVLLARPVAAQTSIFVLDLPGTPVGEIPTAIKQLRGIMGVVIKDGVPMLKASATSEFLISLSQPLPQDFTLEFDIVPKSCCNPQDLSFEGTATINQGAGSAHVLWDSDGYLNVIGGGQTYEAPMPEDFRVSLPGVLTHVVAIFQGPTIRLYTNGRRMFTLDRTFARTRSLRILLGGQDDADKAVYLAGLRIVGGAAPPGVIAVNPPAPPPSSPASPPAPPAVPVPPPPPPPAAPAPPTPPPGTGTPVGPPPTGPGRPPTPTVVPPPPPPPVGPGPGGPGTRPPVTPVPPPPPPSGGPGQPIAPMLVGTGISDITGPIAEVGMMGYGEFSQKTAGLHTRLFARAFIFSSPGTGKRVVFVSTDLAMLFSSVKQGVLKKLVLAYGNQYDDRNVMMSATHTHSGPGGFSHHVMYNLTTYGHIAQNYAAIVDGITEAITQAHQRLATGTVSMMSAEVAETTMVNRSRVAFMLNPEASAVPPADDIERAITVLNIQSGGRPAGSIAWHAVHNTSMPNTNRLVSSDHKGYASYLMERQFGSIAPFQNYGGFVAAFPNGAEGDMSPNLNKTAGSSPAGVIFGGPGRDEFESTYIIGQREFDAAHSLFTNQGRTAVSGVVDYRHMFVIMPGFIVTATKFTNGAGLNFLCPAGYGASFNAGAEDGRAGPATEGLALNSTLNVAQLNSFRAALVATVSVVMPPLGPVVGGAMLASSDNCQLPKPVLIPTGALPNWTPTTLPFQLLRVGAIAIAGIPGEMTMQAGRRLRDSLLVTLAPIGVQTVLLTGLANEYSGYIATPEEYDSQQYEGASTIYGRLTFDAYQQIFRSLATAMVSGQPVLGAPPPPDLSIPQLELEAGVALDEVPAGESFGQVLLQPTAPVTRGPNAQVHVIFRSGHPKNDLRRNDTHFRIERDLGGGNWELVAWDAMPETRLYWSRVTTASPGSAVVGPTSCPGSPCPWSSIGIIWTLPPGVMPGTYRIQLDGKWKNGVTGALVPYRGTTNSFVIQ